MTEATRTTDDPAAATRDYERIASAIRFLTRNTLRQPSLAEAAAHVHLSEHHFQRMFTAWAGVSPKRFLQLLTIEHARHRLAGAPDLSSAAEAVGLSGSGRLHDLYVTLDAVTPGDERIGGRGLIIDYGGFDTVFGRCFLATTSRGICSLHFADDHAPLLDDLRLRWPYAKIVEKQILISKLGSEMLAPLGSGAARPLAVLVKGTNLQVQVWRALLALPAGAVTTYARLAQQVGRPTAVRAVANAVAANPVAWLIPCHRVIRSTGALGGYRWGLERKRLMLGWESAHHPDCSGFT